jgi:hypothetical protein
MFFREKKSKGISYLQVVENRREDGKCKQRVIATLGRLDKLRESGDLESLSASAAKVLRNLTLLSSHRKGETVEIARYRVGPPLVFDRLWKDSGCRDALRAGTLAAELPFDLEQAVFLLVLHLLLDTELTRSPVRWAADYQFDNAAGLNLHHLHRAVVSLGKEPAPSKGSGKKGTVEHSAKIRLEGRLLDRRGAGKISRDVAYIYMVPIREQKRGNGRSLRVDGLRSARGSALMIVAVDSEGLPITHEVSWSREAGKGRLESLVRRLRKEFGFEEIVVVADRRLLLTTEMVTLLKAGCGYLVGTRWSGRFETKYKLLNAKRHVGKTRMRNSPAGGLSFPKIAEVKPGDVSHVHRLDEGLAAREGPDTENMALSRPDRFEAREKPSSAYRKFLQFTKRSRKIFEVVPCKQAVEPHADDKWILETDTDLDIAELTRRYSELWTMERLCRAQLSGSKSSVSIQENRQRTRGQACCSFLALLLARELEGRLRRKGTPLEWNRVVRDLDRLEQVEVEYQGERYLLRSPVGETCGRAFQAAGVAMPPEVKEVVSAKTSSFEPAEIS